MALEYSDNAIKIGFADISINQNIPANQSYLGYFADRVKTPQEQKELLGTLANMEKCYNEPLFADDTKYTILVPPPTKSVKDVGDVQVFPDVKELTTPPMKDETMNDLLVVGAGVLAAYILVEILT